MSSREFSAKNLSAKEDLSANDLSANNRASRDFRRQLEGYGLTTANILYRRPDHRWLLQTYIWQEYDLCPEFPELNKFLNFWLEKLEGPLHSGDGGACAADQARRDQSDRRRIPPALISLF
jgi:uncharacterized protein Usg